MVAVACDARPTYIPDSAEMIIPDLSAIVARDSTDRRFIVVDSMEPNAGVELLFKTAGIRTRAAASHGNGPPPVSLAGVRYQRKSKSAPAPPPPRQDVSSREASTSP